MDAFINNRKYSIIETMPKDKISKIKTHCTPNLEILLSRAEAEIDFLKEPLRLLEIKQEKLKYSEASVNNAHLHSYRRPLVYKN